jgi:hypothetical protein
MERSRYDKKQGLDGISTLTNNPIATFNSRKVKNENDKKYKQKIKRNGSM